MIQKKKKKKQVSSITHSSNSNRVDIIVFNMTMMIVSVPLPFIKHGNKFQSYSNSYGRCVYIMFMYWVKTSMGDKHISFVSLLSYCFVTIWHCLQVSQCFFFFECGSDRNDPPPRSNLPAWWSKLHGATFSDSVRLLKYTTSSGDFQIRKLLSVLYLATVSNNIWWRSLQPSATATSGDQKWSKYDASTLNHG